MNFIKAFFSFIVLCLQLVLLSQYSHAASATMSIHDSMMSLDTSTWRMSDSWNNGAPFQVGWRSDHVDIYTDPQTSAKQLRLRLDDVPCATNAALCANQSYASGEYSSVSLLPYGRVTFTAQAAKNPGIITGLFLYTGQSDGQPHDEIDIEFLGNDSTKVQLNYFVNGVGGHEVLIQLGFDASLAQHRYSIAWKDTAIDWYVDDVLVHSVTGRNLPMHDMRIFSNLWATVGVDTWAGAFVYPKTPIYAYIDSIDYDPLAIAVMNGDNAISTDTVTTSTAGGGCITPPTPEFIWLLGLGFLWLCWYSVGLNTNRKSVVQ
jgi:beta-glucanase (GH16 family)